MRAQEADEGLVKGRTQDKVLEGETREERTEGGARWGSRVQPGRRPMVESRAGGAMVERSSTPPWGRLMEATEMDTQVEWARRRSEVTPET